MITNTTISYADVHMCHILFLDSVCLSVSSSFFFVLFFVLIFVVFYGVSSIGGFFVWILAFILLLFSVAPKLVGEVMRVSCSMFRYSLISVAITMHVYVARCEGVLESARRHFI